MIRTVHAEEAPVILAIAVSRPGLPRVGSGSGSKAPAAVRQHPVGAGSISCLAARDRGVCRAPGGQVGERAGFEFNDQSANPPCLRLAHREFVFVLD